MMWGWGGGPGWGWMVAMGVFWVLLIAGIVLAVVLALRGSSRSRVDDGGGSRARAILEERFARGEIDEEEFRRRLEILDR